MYLIGKGKNLDTILHPHMYMKLLATIKQKYSWSWRIEYFQLQ
jgi:hypothetical protein